MKKQVVFVILLFSLSSTVVSCNKTPLNKTQKRVEQQKKRQKKNPNDCPRIDC